MTGRFVLGCTLALGSAGVSLVACVSDTPASILVVVNDSGTPTADTGSVDASLMDTSPPPVDAACAANTASCDPKQAACSSNLLTESANCGPCGFDCGGKGLCKNGACAPMPVAPNLTAPVSLFVSSTAAYFWGGQPEVASCPITGCTSALNVLLTNTNTPTLAANGAHYLYADATRIFVPGYMGPAMGLNTPYSIFTCPLAGCGQTAAKKLYSVPNYMDELVSDGKSFYWLDSYHSSIYRVDATSGSLVGSLGFSGTTQLQHLATNGTYLFATDSAIPINGGGLYWCSLAGGCKDGTNQLPKATLVTANGATVAVTTSTSMGIDIITCDLAKGCGGVGTTLAPGENGVTSLAMDDTNVYWSIKGSGLATDGTIRMCPIAGCPANGPITVAQNRANPTAVQKVDNFLYWLERGTGTAGSGAVVRIRL